MRRIPWSLLLGVGVGLLLLRSARHRKGARGARARLPREPEVVRLHGPTPIEAGLETALATGSPDPVPGRTVRRVSPLAEEPRPADPDAPAAEPVPPSVRRHRH